MGRRVKAPARRLLDLPLAEIVTNDGTQSRAALNESVVAEYEQMMRDGVAFPEPVVFQDGEVLRLASGFHRLAAAERVGFRKMTFEVHKGGRFDALLYSLKANATHGLRPTPEDKEFAVRKLLREPDAAKWSNRQIAEACAVGHPFVAKVRTSLGQLESIPVEPRKSADGKERNVSGIVAANKARAKKEAPRTLASEVQEAPPDDLPVHQVEAFDEPDLEQPDDVVVVAEVPAAPARAEVPADVAALMDLWRRRVPTIAGHLKAAAKEWAAIEEEMRQLHAAGLWREGANTAIGMHTLGILQHLGEHARHVATSVPFAVCPRCKGAGPCTYCDGAGWLAKDKYDHAPAEWKAEGAGAGA